MDTGIGYDKCLTFINCQIAPAKPTQGTGSPPTRFNALTFSRESGSGAHEVAEKLAARLQAHEPPGRRPWTMFDRELITKALEDHHFPARMAEFIPEDRRTELQDAVEELFGLRPPSWTLIQQISETVLRLVELGNVILIGRGANVVARNHPGVLHIRLTGSTESRAARIARARNLSRKEAAEVLKAEDRGRARYLKKYFNADIDDPVLYHATFNTDLLTLDRIVDLVNDLMLNGPGARES